MTIQQIQDAIDNKIDSRQIINMIADYIQSNPSGGSGTTPTWEETLIQGSQFSQNNSVDLNGNAFEMLNAAGQHGVFVADATVGQERAYIKSTNDTGDANLALLSTETTPTEAITKVQANYQDNAKNSLINLRTASGVATIEYTTDIHTFHNAIITPELAALDFADDTAAAGGGVAVNQWYHTSGTLKIRLI